MPVVRQPSDPSGVLIRCPNRGGCDVGVRRCRAGREPGRGLWHVRPGRLVMFQHGLRLMQAIPHRRGCYFRAALIEPHRRVGYGRTRRLDHGQLAYVVVNRHFRHWGPGLASPGATVNPPAVAARGGDTPRFHPHARRRQPNLTKQSVGLWVAAAVLSVEEVGWRTGNPQGSERDFRGHRSAGDRDRGPLLELAQVSIGACGPDPVTNQVTMPPGNAGRSTTQPDTAIPPTCGNTTQSDGIRRNRHAW